MNVRETKDLAIVMVTWNVRNLALNALHSLYDDLESTKLTADVYVVDNASDDGTVEAIQEAFPDIIIIANEHNFGFGAANNLALRQAGFGTSPNAPKAAYLINSDTITHPGATRALFDVLMSEKRIGLVGAQLFYSDGSFQHSAFEFPGLRQIWAEFFPTPGRMVEGEFNGRYDREAYEQKKPFRVDFTLGATMMIKREVIAETGMFDEAYFMYCEEIDWAWRIRRAGWKAYCVPRAHITHIGGQSTKQIKPRSVIHLWESRMRLFKTYYPPWKFEIARRLIARGMLQRANEEANPEIRDALLEVRRIALES